MILRILISLAIVCNSLSLKAQEDLVKDKLRNYYKIFQPEYADMHLAGDIYNQGQIVWYKIYLKSNSVSRMNLSSVVYVELIDENRQLLLRQKLKCVDGRAHGEIILPSEIPMGKYIIQCYTLWMKNVGEESYYKTEIVVADSKNNTNPIAANEKNNTSHKLISWKNADDSLFIALDTLINGFLLIHHDDHLLVTHKIDSHFRKNLALSIKNLKESKIRLTLFSSEWKFIFSTTASIERNNQINVALKTNKLKYRPRDKVLLSCQTKNTSGKGIIGSFSISVRKKNDKIINQSNLVKTTPWNKILSSDFRIAEPKETIVYPPQSNTLQPIYFSNIETTPVTSNKNIWDEIKDAYNLEDTLHQNGLLTLPFDNRYSPQDFSPMLNLEAFIKEVVPQVRIKNKKGLKTIQLRNIENSQKIFFYSKNPLLLINNKIITNTEQFLDLNPLEIKSMQITWKSQTINKSGISSLADNGILAVYMENKSIDLDAPNVLKDFHCPSTFNGYDYSNKIITDDAIPDFRELVYWNPFGNTEEKSQYTFYLSDEIGEFEIDIVGYTEDGQRFSEKKIISVEF